MILLLALFAVSASDNPAPKEGFYRSAQNKTSDKRGQLQNKLLWINQINLVVTKICTYNDKLVLTLEYEKLVDSVNFNNLPDGQLRDAVKELIRTLKSLSDSWDQKETARKEYIKSCDRAFRNALVKGVATVFDESARENFSLPLKGCLPLIRQTANVAADLVTVKERLVDEHEKEMRKIAVEDAAKIHELRNKIWDVFSAEFSGDSLRDQDRLSVQDCKSFINILKNGSVEGQYTVLSGENNKTRYRCLPVYWYYLGYTASQLNKNEEAMKYLARFKQIYRNLFRYDTYAVSALILETRILMQDPVGSRTRILDKLDELVKNIENRDWKSRYFASLCYFQMNDPETAFRLLKQNIEYLTIQTREASNPPVRNLFGDANIPIELLPDGESIAVNRQLLTMVRLRKGEPLKKIIDDFMNGFAVSAYEKVRFLGAADWKTVFGLMEKDVRGITMELHHRVVKPYVEIQMPAPWFYVAEPPIIALDFVDPATKKTTRLDEKYSFLGWNSENRSIRLAFPINSSIKIPEQADEILLTIQHQGLSLQISYKLVNPQLRKQEEKASTKWEKIQHWSKKTIHKGKSAWSQVYDYAQSGIMINGKSFPLNETSGERKK